LLGLLPTDRKWDAHPSNPPSDVHRNDLGKI